MPFAKGNTLWKEAKIAKAEKQAKIDEFMYILADDGMAKYADIMDKLAQGIELTKQEIEYMDRMEKWTEYIRPKLARQENKQVGDININIGWEE